MHKNNVPGVAHAPFNFMEKAHYSSRDSVAWSAIGLIYGKRLLTVFYTISTGSNYGLLKAVLLTCFVGYPVTVNSKSPVSRITGWNKLQERSWTTRELNTLFMMPHIFTRTAV